MSTAIVGIGRTAYTMASGRTTRAMAVEACRQALDDAGLGIADVDGICTFMVNDSASAIDVGWALGRDDMAWCNTMLAGGNAVADQIATAAAVIEAGLCRGVLLYRSLNGRSGHRFGTVTGPMTVEGDMQVDVSSGFLVPPQWFAMWARRHQLETGSTAEDLGAIAITQRSHAVANEHAIRREPLSMDEYLAGRWVAEPFRIFDCTSEVDGACAVLMVGEDLVKDVKTTPIWLVGSSNSQSGSGWMNWSDPTKMYAATAGPKIWAKTGLTAAEMDFACMYDCFTYTVMATMEGYGFCERGEVGAFFREGRATYGGDVVVNPHGGLLSEGYIHGLNHHYESTLQLRHRAGARQVDGAEVALVTAGGGPYGGANVYSRTKP
jgi:acetyl-CoA acetyltransferase